MAKRSLIVGVLVILSLAFSGIAYAAWTKTIQVTGTLTTAKVDIKWVEKAISFVYSPEAPREIDSTLDITPTWVSGNKVKIDIQNAFPGFEATFDLEIENEGTMPVNVRLFSHGLQGEDTPVRVTIADPNIDETGAEELTFFLNTGNNNNTQEIRVRVYIPGGVEGYQNKRLHFYVEAEATQWNIGTGQ